MTEAATLLGGFNGTGLEAGDAICNKLASDAGLQDSYTAWLSGSGAGQNAKERVTNAPVPYLRTDGIKLADNFLQFITPPDMAGAVILGGAICFDESSVIHCEPAGKTRTGTTIEGILAVNANCENWTCSSSKCNALVGNTDNSVPGRTTKWTADRVLACDTDRRIYCFQD